VLAGTNGAGKSSILGEMVLASGAEYFNPDEAARLLREANPRLAQEEANAAAWHEGKRLLERAIAEGLDYAFETTLGGATITRLLSKALVMGLEVRLWYVGLESAELHLERVRKRVERGGHDIPEDKIRERFDAGRRNLLRLLPSLTELKVFDNSAAADPHEGHAPRPLLILHTAGGEVVEHCPLEECPEWAKPIVAAAFTSRRR
jgi:predicted ABC-type ATPase